MEGLRVSNPRNWWRSVKLLTGQTVNKSEPLTGFANQLHDGNIQALADNINRFFQGVAADLSPLDDNSTPPPPDVIPDKFIISLADVERKLSHINVHKSPAPDGLPNWLLRDFSSNLAGPVCAIYNASVREGFIPSMWKEANVVPVPKVQPPKAVKTDLRQLTHSYTCQGARVVRRIMDWTGEQQSQQPAVRRPQTTLYNAHPGQHAAPLARRH